MRERRGKRQRERTAVPAVRERSASQRPSEPVSARPSRALSPIRTVWSTGRFAPMTNRRPWSHTRSTGRRLRPGRGLPRHVPRSPPVRNFTESRQRVVGYCRVSHPWPGSPRSGDQIHSRSPVHCRACRDPALVPGEIRRHIAFRRLGEAGWAANPAGGRRGQLDPAGGRPDGQLAQVAQRAGGRAPPDGQLAQAPQRPGGQLVRRSTATYDPGCVFATDFISVATETTSCGSVNLREVETATPTEMVTRLARRTWPRRSVSSR